MLSCYEHVQTEETFSLLEWVGRTKQFIKVFFSDFQALLLMIAMVQLFFRFEFRQLLFILLS